MARKRFGKGKEVRKGRRDKRDRKGTIKGTEMEKGRVDGKQ